jgi:hypothetical protein
MDFLRARARGRQVRRRHRGGAAPADGSEVHLPRRDRAGQVAAGTTYRIGDLELASRLSFFLWSSIPDDELLKLAEQGKLMIPKVLSSRSPHARRPALGGAGQELRRPVAERPRHRGQRAGGEPVPGFRQQRCARRSGARRSCSSTASSGKTARVQELLTADYTFVNERLAKHYGIPGIYGSQFRRVTLGPRPDMRKRLLGKGSAADDFVQPRSARRRSCAASGSCRT